MQRYFIQPAQRVGDMVFIEGNDVHHMKHVMRFRPGDQVICCDGQGIDLQCRIESINKEQTILQVVNQKPSQGEPQRELVLWQSLLKGERWDWVLQKSTELGVKRIVPFLSERTIVKIDAHKQVKKQERWQRIVKEAAEQAHRGVIPIVESVRQWEEVFPAIAERQTFLASEYGGAPIEQILQQQVKQRYLQLIIGPEGGFSQQEVTALCKGGALPVSLGSRILRAETAALVALTCCLYIRG